MDRSIEGLRRQLKRDPDDGEALEALARRLIRLGDREDAYALAVDAGPAVRGSPWASELGQQLAEEERALLKNKRKGEVVFGFEKGKRGDWKWLKPSQALAKRRPVLAVRASGKATKTLLKRLAGLRFLQELRLSHEVNEAALDLIPLSALARLRSLALQSTRGTASVLGKIARLSSLRSLELEGCELVDPEALAALRALPELSRLELSRTRLDERGLAGLTACRGIRALDLSGCRLGDAGLAALAAFDRLEELDLAFCQGINDADLAALGGMSSLRELRLDRAKITDAGLAELVGLKSLRSLSISGCRSLTSKGMAALSRLPRLKTLNLDHVVKLTDRGLRHLAECRSLRRLSLRGCEKISGRGLAGLSFLSNHQDLIKQIERLVLDDTVPSLSYPQFAELACRLRQSLDGLDRAAFSEPKSWRVISACMYAHTEEAEIEGDWRLTRSEACFGPAEIGLEIGWGAGARGLPEGQAFGLSTCQRRMGEWSNPELRLTVSIDQARHESIRAAWKAELARLNASG